MKMSRMSRRGYDSITILLLMALYLAVCFSAGALVKFLEIVFTKILTWLSGPGFGGW